MKLRSLTFGLFLASLGLSAQEIIPTRILAPYQPFYSEGLQNGDFNLNYGYGQNGHAINISFRQSLASPLYLAIDLISGISIRQFDEPLAFSNTRGLSQQTAALGYCTPAKGDKAWRHDLRLSFSHSFILNLIDPSNPRYSDAHDLNTVEIKLSYYAAQNKSSGFVAGASIGLMRVYSSTAYEPIQSDFFYEPDLIDGARGNEMPLIIEPGLGYFARLSSNLQWNFMLNGVIGIHDYDLVKTNALMLSTGLQISWLKD